MPPRWGVVLVGAGGGNRFGGPKALATLAGVTLLERCARAFAFLPDRVAVLRAEDCGSVRLEGWRIVPGGARRRDSVACGLAALRDDTDHVLVHDVARPLVSGELIARVQAAVVVTGAAIPVVPLVDTVKRIAEGEVVGTPDRSTLAAAQTPQGFVLSILRRALAASTRDATDDAGLVEELGLPVAAVAGDPRNLKITSPDDLIVAQRWTVSE
ncbi:MAG: IspD/TarI family cytidylyltransferase [Planctomycetaceae bacterium]